MSSRDEMLEEIVADYRRTVGYTGLREPDPRVMRAMAAVPRDRFVSPSLRPWAWANQALNIPCGQTISQPYIVALMTDVLRLEEGARVLEIGAGSGYQTAVLLEMGATVFGVELHADLARAAAERLTGLGYSAFSIRAGDGREGWVEHAPYDRILVAAAARDLPSAFGEQLVAGGRIVIPLDAGFDNQVLTLLEKEPGGRLRSKSLLPVRFVPLLRGR